MDKNKEEVLKTINLELDLIKYMKDKGWNELACKLYHYTNILIYLYIMKYGKIEIHNNIIY
jgi:hypothetical protein